MPALLGLLASLLASPLNAAPAHVPGQVLVKLKNLPAYLPASMTAGQLSTLPSGPRELLARHGARGLKRVFPGVTAPAGVSPAGAGGVSRPDLYGWTLVEVSTGADVPALAAALAQDPSVEAAQPNVLRRLSRTPNDAQFASQWYHNNTGQTGGDAGDDVSSLEAWDLGVGSTQTVVAVLDTGADLTHPDLAANLGPTHYDFIQDDSTPQDTDGHGTHVAGIVAAVGDNGTGVAGMMWSAKLMIVRVCQVSCPISAIAAGLHFAADNGARVVNLSLGGDTDFPVERDAVAYAVAAGVLVVAAAGNDNTNALHYPAAYPSVVSVAALDHRDQRASFSSYGSWVSISAPGTNILSTYPPSTYTALQGTSMASPVVAGVAGLIFANRPSWTAAQARSRLLATADAIDAENPGFAGQLGAGRVNAAAAVPPRWEVVSLSLTPDDATVANGASASFTTTISTPLTAGDVRVTLVDQLGRELGPGNTVQWTLPTTTSVNGSVQLGAVSLNSPLASLIRLRFVFGTPPFVFNQDVKTWALAEINAVPRGGHAAVWNPVLQPSSGRSATVRLTLRAAGRVKVSVHRGDGTLVRRLAEQDASAGVVSWDWDGRNEQGRMQASGVYLVRIEGPGFSQIKKIVLVR